MIINAVDGVQVKAIVGCAPTNEIKTSQYPYFDDEQAINFEKATGIKSRRIVDGPVCTSDLCETAIKRLLDMLDWDKSEIKVLIHISQSPERGIPSTAIIMQNRLGFSDGVIAFDVNLGCSAYPYGFYLMNTIMGSLPAGSKGILSVGDISSLGCEPSNKATAALFSDVGTATAFEHTSNISQTQYNFYSDGSGADVITVLPAGPASRYPNEKPYLKMNGPDVFSFAISKVPLMIKESLSLSHISVDSLDFSVLHQANLMVNNRILKKSKIDHIPSLTSICDYGNTSAGSIPFTSAANIKELSRDTNFLLVGFGVGLSWASVVTTFPSEFVSDLIYLDCKSFTPPL